jgi:NAD(P)-dependent dehydrogenase (short-subunit alcohol dehydrogenase family)
MNKILLSLMLIFFSTMISTGHANDKAQQAVLVTGASSGIGLQITKTLADNGYLVYAGARKEDDLKRLEAMDNVESVRLDVTKQAEIDAAVKTIEAKGRGLYGLVNNAGIVVLGPLIEVPIEELQWQFDVNVYGPYRVTQAFAPLIIASKGRISTTGSISGILSGDMFGHYSMSKHAIEAYTDSLASEMARFEVQVSVIEPGNYKSNIGENFAKRFASKDYLPEGSAYASDLEQLMSRMSAAGEQKEPIAVADAVLHALSAEKPKRRYMVTPNKGSQTSLSPKPCAKCYSSIKTTNIHSAWKN